MNMEKLFDKCSDAYLKDDYEKAMKICDEILKTDPDNPKALGYKASCLHFIGKSDEALELLDNAIRLHPENYHYLEIMAEILTDMGQYADAIKCYRRIFEIGVSDETALSFIRMDYKACLALWMDELIEREKYVDAFRCYGEELEFDSVCLERSKMIEQFKRHVRERTTKVKKRKYHVRPSSNEAKNRLIEFLEENGFECREYNALVFGIDVVDKVCCGVSADDVGCDAVISESKFYDKVNYYPRGEIERKRIYSEDGNLLYEGYTLHNAPYGFGTAYFADGTIYRQGIFDIKGIAQGEEYYPSGQLRFKGEWSLTHGYGPNAPYDGDAYSEDGKLLYSGRFEIRRGGVGWPRIINPKGFPLEQNGRPKIEYL